jgi:hypothetical protein
MGAKFEIYESRQNTGSRFLIRDLGSTINASAGTEWRGMPGPFGRIDATIGSIRQSSCPAMPEISRFLGIVVRMYYRDHAPPHFHADYAEHEIEVEIETGIVEGRFPRRALRAVLEWYEAHRDELRVNWQLARDERPLNAIDPLE